VPINLSLAAYLVITAIAYGLPQPDCANSRIFVYCSCLDSLLHLHLKLLSAMAYDLTSVSLLITKAQNLEPLTTEETLILEHAYTVIWNRIQTQPNYVMTALEFKVFNYFQRRWKGNNVAQQAVARHWATRNNANGIV
jgi:hypothetical protein